MIKCTCCNTPITGIGNADNFRSVLVGILCMKCYSAVQAQRYTRGYLKLAEQYLARIDEQTPRKKNE